MFFIHIPIFSLLACDRARQYAKTLLILYCLYIEHFDSIPDNVVFRCLCIGQKYRSGDVAMLIVTSFPMHRTRSGNLKSTAFLFLLTY